MTISRFARAVVYAFLSLAVTGLCVWMTAPMYAENTVDAYLRSEILLFVLACCILGAGVYGLFALSRRYRELRQDSWFLLAVGALVMLIAVIVICRYGGVSDQNYDDSVLAAFNLNLMLIGALPLPFLIRTLIVTLSVREKSLQRVIAWIALVLAAAVFVTLVATGHLMHTVETVTSTAETVLQ